MRGFTPLQMHSCRRTIAVAPCTRGFTDSDPKTPPKRSDSDMKNRTVMVRMLNSEQVASVTEHAKNLGALAFEVHEKESGEYCSIKDAREYYHNGYTNHPYVEEAIEAGYTLNNWDDLSYADKCEFTEMVELYSEGDDYMAPDLNETWENFNAFIASHSGWLQNVKPEHSG